MAQLKSGLLRARSAGSGAGDGQRPIAMPGFRGALAFILHFAVARPVKFCLNHYVSSAASRARAEAVG